MHELFDFIYLICKYQCIEEIELDKEMFLSYDTIILFSGEKATYSHISIFLLLSRV